ncbi:MAG: OB-fold nucleic acid binding domain-containing protein [Dermatophilaceae bacterium]|nr:OB-fold nucleic acid binding domain-containing protein [Dermatophilaceae bacterium]
MTAGLSRTESELEARELQENTWRLGVTPIKNLVDRSEASVCGAVRSVTLRPRVNVPALVAEVYDGSKTLNVIWLGRRRIGGIVPGTYLTVHGRVTYRHGIPTIFNPAYEIRPAHGH